MDRPDGDRPRRDRTVHHGARQRWQIAYSDVQRSVETGRPVFVIAGSGRTADVFVGALAGAPADERAAALVDSGLIRSVPVDEPGVLAELLAAALGESAAK